MSKTKMNLANFDILMQAILDNYQSFNIYKWGQKVKKSESPCGSVGCIAGTADWLANRSGMKPAEGCNFLFDKNGFITLNKKDKFIQAELSEKWATENASKWLGVDSYEAKLLFLPSEWPTFFKDALFNYDSGTNGQARIAVSRIQYFLATGE